MNTSLVLVSVVVDLPQYSGVDMALSYLHPLALEPGTLVKVPLGRREVWGLVWQTQPAQARPESEGSSGPVLKPVSAVLDVVPPLSPTWRQLIAFTAEYYRRGVGEVALSVLPPELRKAEPAALARRCQRLWRHAHRDALKDGASTAGAQQESRGRTAEVKPPEALPVPTAEQAQALSVLGPWPCGADGGPPVLLHGVTGSGKTEVYLRLAAQALQNGRQVLVMVPEINLTPQLEERLRRRFAGHELVALHSGLTPAQRVNHWLSAHLGRADLVLGTRMAVMASMPRLGLIVVDEEHDPSYKQQEGARYSARDLAIYRGRLEGIPVILGSATPSLETWRHAQDGRYRLVSMGRRVGDGALPQVQLIDMNRMPRAAGGGSILSPSLVAAIQQRIDRGEQSLLLLNRRGYAPVLHCSACGWKSECAHCSAWQVFHKVDRSLRCHHCGAAQRVPKACPDCGNLDLSAIGRGTERLEEQLAPLLTGRQGVDGPPPRILRIDADTTRKAGSLEAQLAQVHEGDVDVLVGTQMVAKGHDFRRITLVAAVNPDGALFTSDFRAPERLFALLMQAAGRAGRDAQQAGLSQMLVQTWHPMHPLYQALIQHDYEAFARSQLQERATVGLPPSSHLALLRVESRTVQAAQDFLTQAAQAVAEAAEQAGIPVEAVMVYPPVPAPVAGSNSFTVSASPPVHRTTGTVP